jgi:hypothetical protein
MISFQLDNQVSMILHHFGCSESRLVGHLQGQCENLIPEGWRTVLFFVLHMAIGEPRANK